VFFTPTPTPTLVWCVIDLVHPNGWEQQVSQRLSQRNEDSARS
jgi:hypothetical protein